MSRNMYLHTFDTLLISFCYENKINEWGGRGKEKEETKGKERKKSAETRDYSEFMRTLRIWTRDLQIFSLTLSQLSYLGSYKWNGANLNI